MTYQQYARHLFTSARTAPLLEWQAVIFFYAAVHATNSVLYGPCGAPLTHTKHEANLVASAAFDLLMIEYQELKSLSLMARYQPHLHPMTPAQVDHAERLATVLLTACNVP